jgi:Predicted membrane protein
MDLSVDLMFDVYNLLLLPIIPLLYYMGIKTQAFNKGGAISAAIIGIIVIIGGGVIYFVILFVFLGLSYIATMLGIKEKSKKKLQEGLKGERGAKNVIAAGLAPAAISIMNIFYSNPVVTFVLFVISLGVILSDTSASEIGSLDHDTFMILTLKRAIPGTNGAVSILGTVVSLVFSILFSFLSLSIFQISYYLPFDKYLNLALIAGIIGFIGNIIDSILGEIFENRNLMDKHTVNLSSAVIGTLLAWLII